MNINGAPPFVEGEAPFYVYNYDLEPSRYRPREAVAC